MSIFGDVGMLWENGHRLKRYYTESKRVEFNYDGFGDRREKLVYTTNNLDYKIKFDVVNNRIYK